MLACAEARVEPGGWRGFLAMSRTDLSAAPAPEANLPIRNPFAPLPDRAERSEVRGESAPQGEKAPVELFETGRARHGPGRRPAAES